MESVKKVIQQVRHQDDPNVLIREDGGIDITIDMVEDKGEDIEYILLKRTEDIDAYIKSLDDVPLAELRLIWEKMRNFSREDRDDDQLFISSLALIRMIVTQREQEEYLKKNGEYKTVQEVGDEEIEEIECQINNLESERDSLISTVKKMVDELIEELEPQITNKENLIDYDELWEDLLDLGETPDSLHFDFSDDCFIRILNNDILEEIQNTIKWLIPNVKRFNQEIEKLKQAQQEVAEKQKDHPSSLKDLGWINKGGEPVEPPPRPSS